MGKRNINFTEGEYYHIYNRGVDKRYIFEYTSDYLYFFKRLIDLNQKQSHSRITTLRSRNKESIINNIHEKLVEIVAYNLLPNHFHLILKEKTEDGIPRFMQKVGTSYTKYFNNKNNRTGALFQGKFKAKHIIGNLSLPTLSVYVNLNHKHHNISGNNIYSSMFEYTKNNESKKIRICDKKSINLIKNEIITDYEEFAQKQSELFQSNKEKQAELEY